jgi:FkbM family methyltransferase
MDDDLTWHAESAMWARPNTKDEMILNEVLVERTYGMTPIEFTDVVLDIGGNIGAAAEFFLDRGAKHVVSYEPDPDNVRVFNRNMARSIGQGLVTIHRAAVTHRDGYVNLYTNNGPNKACHSVIPKRGYSVTEVPAVSLESILNAYHPSVIKCDIEGGEYGLPWELLDKHREVRVLVIEVHTQKPEWRIQHAPALMALIEVLGFEQVTNVNAEFKSGWPKRIIWQRPTAAPTTTSREV